MTSATADNPRILIGASIPRSGHHFLADMLSAYFGSDLYYCEYYTLPNCCKSAPCTRRGRFSYIYQKSHDRDFALPADIAHALYLIQYRHPVPEALSDRELELKDMLGRPSLSFRRTHAGYALWLAKKAIYYRKFHDKWIARRIPNALYLDYAELAASPQTVLAEILKRAAGGVDATRVSGVVERLNAPRASSKTGGTEPQSFKPRVISDSPHFDPALLGALESWVLERCPHFGFARELDGDFRTSELYGLILLKDQDEPLPEGETKRLRAAANLAPDHPEILRRFATRMIREGKVAQGITRLERLVTRHPYFAPAYEILFKACADSGTPVPEAALTGNALIACSESVELSMRLGAAFAEKEWHVNAVAAFSLACALEPGNAQANERRTASASAARR
jgi:hypothetical protein